MPSVWLLLVAVYSLGACFVLAKRNRWRFSLGTLLLLFTIVNVLVAVAAERHRAERRASRAERKARHLVVLTKEFNGWRDHLKQELAKHLEDPEYYDELLGRADNDEMARLKEVERAVDAFKN